MLKKLFTLAILTSLSTSLFAKEESSFVFNSKPKKITENVWCFLGETTAPTKENAGFMSNSCYIKTEQSYVLVDSGSSYNFAKHSYEMMSEIAKLPVSHIIVTHVHDDHWLGNSYFKEKFNSKILGPSLINKHHHEDSKTRMFNILPKQQMQNTKVVKVDEVINEKTSMFLSEMEIQIIPAGHTAHTQEDLMVYLPKLKVFFAGDIVMNGRVTSNRDGNLLGLMKTLDTISSMDWDYLVAGHGHNTSKTAADEIKLYTKLLKQRVLEAIENEVEASNITNVVTLDEFKDVSMYELFNKRNVFDAFGELEFYEEE